MGGGQFLDFVAHGGSPTRENAGYYDNMLHKTLFPKLLTLLQHKSGFVLKFFEFPIFFLP